MPRTRPHLGRTFTGHAYAARAAARLALGTVALGLAAVYLRPVTAQEEGGTLGEGVQPVMVRELARGIARAEASIEAGEYVQALRFLDEVLGRDDDSFVEGSGHGKFVGLKARAAEILRELPPAGRDAYQAAYAPVAQRELREAVGTGDLAQLRRVVQRYLNTPAGQEAALLLAQRELDAGRRHSAALLYGALLADPSAKARFEPQLSALGALAWEAAGDPQRATAIRNESPGGRVIVAGRPESIAPGGEESVIAELVGAPVAADSSEPGDWLTHRGNARRNAETRGGLPHLRMRWQVRTLPHPELEKTYEDLAADLRQSRQLTPVAAQPLAIGDMLIARTAHTLYGIDFTTGKLLWHAAPGEAIDLEQLLPRDALVDGSGQDGNASAMIFAKQIWQNSVAGLTSSDGRRVFAVRITGRPPADDEEMWRQGPFGRQGEILGESTNRLSCYDVSAAGPTAREPTWTIDGADPDGPLPGAWFLGAPLAVGQSAFAIVDLRDEVNLVALSAATGEVLWRQPLANLDYYLAFDQDRKRQGAMPSYADGILVCPTGGGIVIGYDLATRSLAWAYQYRRRESPEPYTRRVDETEAEGPAGRWIDAAATIADDRVLLTPPESNELHCLDLRTGELLWTQDRANMLSIACVAEGRVLLVGNQKATALHLADGKPAWETGSLRWPDGALPTGTGFLADGSYYVPLSSGEVLAVSAATGEITARCGGSDMQPLGNLICHRGAVLSQTGRYLERYDQIDQLRAEATAAIAADADDVDALRTLGEIALSEGRRSEAIDRLERAYQLAPDDVDVRDVLAEALTDALLKEFAAYRAKLPLLEELQDGTLQRRLTVLRIRAQGLLAVGDVSGAAEACLALYRLVDLSREPLDLGVDYSADPRRWLSAQVAAVYEAADEQQQSQLLERIDRLRAEAAAGEGDDQAARFLRCFGNLPGNDTLRLTRARWLIDQQRWFAAQQVAWSLLEADDPQVRAEAVGVVLEGLVASGNREAAARFAQSRPAEAAKYFEKLGMDDSERMQRSADPPSLGWPQGRVSVKTPATPRDNARYGGARTPMWGVPLERTDALLGSSTVSLAVRSNELRVSDSRGRDTFFMQVPGEARSAYREPGDAYAISRGSLLVVSMGHRIVPLNTLGVQNDLDGPLLWTPVSVVSGFDQQQRGVETGGQSWGRPGTARPSRSTIDGRWVGVLGPATSHGFVYQDQRRLTCVDPLTGEMLWQRGDAPSASDLYGDEQFVFVVPRTSRKAHVYSAIDGRALGTRTVPSWREQLATRGRVVVAWRRESSGQVLSAVDAWTGDAAWSHTFDRNAAVDVAANELAAVVEPNGRVVLVELATGAVLTDYQGPVLSSVDEVHLLAGADAVAVLASQRSPRADERRISLFNPHDYATINGFAYVFRRDDGQMTWNQPAELRQQALMLTQGPDLPALVFASGLSTRNSQGTRSQTTMLLLDKATGRTLMRTDELPSAAGGYCQPRVANVAEGGPPQLEVEMSNRTVAVSFTDRPRPPAPPAMAEVEAGSGDSRGGLTRLLKSVIDGGD